MGLWDRIVRKLYSEEEQKLRTSPLGLALFPFLAWLPFLTRRSLKADLLAGLTGAVMVLPQGVAFATIAGLPPEYGLYSAMVPTIVAALWGSSHHLVSGPTTAIAIVIFANLSAQAAPFSEPYIQLALNLTFLVGVLQLGMGLAKMGGMLNFVSHSVMSGFTTGAALLIATSQAGHFLGVHESGGGAFLAAWAGIIHRLPQTNLHAAVVALATFLTALAVRRINPRWPALLLAMVAGSLLAAGLGASEHHIALVGSLPGGLPPFSLPLLDFEGIRTLTPSAVAVAMLGLAEAASISRAMAQRSEQRIDPNQEFVGQGLSNLVGSFSSSFASSGSFTRSGLNLEAGAKTPLAAVAAALFLAAILALVAPLTAYLPMPAMAGAILLVAFNLIDATSIRHIWRAGASEAAVFGITFLATLFINLEFAIFGGVMLSLLLYLRRTSHPHFVVLAPAPVADEEGGASDRRTLIEVRDGMTPECPQLKILRLDGSIFFGAVNHIADELHKITAAFPEQCHLLIVGSGINFMDLSGCEMLFHERHSLVLSGRDLYLCSLKPEVAVTMARGPCGHPHRNNIFPNKAEAIRNIVKRLDPVRCQRCRQRVFAECACLPGGPQYEGAVCLIGDDLSYE